MYVSKVCREMAETETKVSFKKISKRSVRVRKESDEEDNAETEEMNKEEFEKTRELQKLRKRAAGTNIETLASVKKQNVDDDDPLGLKKGGMMDVKAMKNMKKNDDAYDVGTQFSKETHIRDEDDEMRKFIDTEMSKIKGVAMDEAGEEKEKESEFLSPEDAAIKALPQHLTRSTFKKDQQMISSQMLTGIPEVDLGIDVKIQNIERTEKAKKKLMADNKKKNLELEDAQDFVQHDRWRDINEIEMVRDDTERVKVNKPIQRPNTVNIYKEDEDSALRNTSQESEH